MSELIAAPDKRTIERLSVRLVVQGSLESAPWGFTRDISIDGFFLVATSRLPVGQMVPVRLQLDSDGTVEAQAEVMRHAPEGMGMRFAELTPESRRQLRRYLAQLTTIDRQRDTVQRLHDPATRTTEPVTDASAIESRLVQAQQKKVETRLIPAERPAMDVGRIRKVTSTALVVESKQTMQVRVGEPVLVLLTLDYVSYSFDSEVVAVREKEAEIRFPTRLVFSERRLSNRVAAPDSARLRVPAPWLPEGAVEWQVVDTAPGGLGLLSNDAVPGLFRGTPLEGATLVIDGRSQPLENAVVRNIQRVQQPDGATAYRIGIATGTARQAVVDTAIPGEKADAGILGKVTTLVQKAKDWTILQWHTKVKKPVPNAAAANSPEGTQLVRFAGSRGMRLAALVDRAFADEVVPKCPVVVVVPGFGGRKEQTSYLANILVDHFRRHHQQVMVVRLDGTNNLGESDKDAGCEVDGKHTLHYTVGGAADDLMDTLAWLRRGEIVQATDVTVVSVSFSSVGVRSVLASGRTPEVRRWVAWMGAADARDAVLHVSGHFDVFKAAEAAKAAGVRMPQVTLIGCIVDAQRFYDDLVDRGIGTLDDARRELGQVDADVLWMRGTHDAWMDPRRIEDILSVPAKGSRAMVSVESGHVPRTGEEAIRQFTEITSWVQQGIFGRAQEVRPPALGWLEAMSRLEWQRVRRAPPRDAAAWWADYLLDDRGPGFDILQRSPAYVSFMDRQADVAQVGGLEVLELGAGTGNLSGRILAREPASLTITDLVPEATDRLRLRYMGDPRVQVRTLNIEGGPWLAMDRYRRGEFEDLQSLFRRIPGVPADMPSRLGQADRVALNAMLKGFEVEIADLELPVHVSSETRQILQELRAFAHAAAGSSADAEALGALHYLQPGPPTVLRGLPFADASFDRVVMSLVLSYLEHPLDALSEIRRVLRPGGTLVMSTMRRDADSSRIFLNLIEQLEAAAVEELGDETTRQALIASARRFMDRASDLFRLEEEGVYRFWTSEEFVRLARLAGFGHCAVETSFGDPPQAVLLCCTRTT